MKFTLFEIGSNGASRWVTIGSIETQARNQYCLLHVEKDFRFYFEAMYYSFWSPYFKNLFMKGSRV